MHLFLLASSLIANPPLEMNAQVWLDKLTANGTAWERHLNNGDETWKAEIVEDDITPDGKVVRSRRKEFDIVRLERRVFWRLMRIDGTLIPAEEARKQAAEEREFIAATRAARAKGRPDPVDEDHIIFDAAFLKRYIFTVVGREPRDGRTCVLLTFKGRSTASTFFRPQETILRKVRGKLWLDEESGSIVHLEAGLPEPVTVGIIAATAESFKITYDQQKFPSGLWGPKRIEMTLHARILFSRRDEHQVATFTF